MMLRLIVAATALLAVLPAHAQLTQGRVVAVHDGDTLTLDAGGRRVSVRLADIDAPELAQRHGPESRNSLQQICMGKEAVINVQDIDQHGRVVAVVSCDGVDASRAQVHAGMAWAFRKYLRRVELLDLESLVRQSGVGLWSNREPVAPWDWRAAVTGGEDRAAVMRGLDARSSMSAAAAAAATSGSRNSRDQTIHVGPRGGRYQINNTGTKDYVQD